MTNRDAHRLVSDTQTLLRSLDDPHVRDFMALWPADEAPHRARSATPLPVLRWLPREQTASSVAVDTLVQTLEQAATQLAWKQTYRAEDFGQDFLDRYGWTELIGERGMVASSTLACGFLLLGPDIEYPDHHHRAEEIYVVLSGTARWRRGDTPWCYHWPGTVIWHPSDMSHAMRTNSEPLLALYLWRGGNLSQKSQLGVSPSIESLITAA